MTGERVPSEKKRSRQEIREMRGLSEKSLRLIGREFRHGDQIEESGRRERERKGGRMSSEKGRGRGVVERKRSRDQGNRGELEEHELHQGVKRERSKGEKGS